MRWMWIDRVVDFQPESRLVAIKDIDAALANQRTHIPGMNDGGRMDVLPMPLVIEGMAQTAGILVGSVNGFREKVILAKVSRARLEADLRPGDTVRFDATLDRIDDKGASTSGLVQRSVDHGASWEDLGTIDLLFSHVDQNMAGIEFPEENFVFSDNFRDLLVEAGLDHLDESSS